MRVEKALCKLIEFFAEHEPDYLPILLPIAECVLFCEVKEAMDTAPSGLVARAAHLHKHTAGLFNIIENLRDDCGVENPVQKFDPNWGRMNDGGA